MDPNLRPAPERGYGLDGVVRSRAKEAELNALFHACFTSPAGREVLAHLRSITIEAVGGPGISDAELRHREGQRFIVGLIQGRVTLNELEHINAARRLRAADAEPAGEPAADTRSNRSRLRRRPPGVAP